MQAVFLNMRSEQRCCQHKGNAVVIPIMAVSLILNWCMFRSDGSFETSRYIMWEIKLSRRVDSVPVTVTDPLDSNTSRWHWHCVLEIDFSMISRIQTRIADWKAKVLPTSYVLKQLEEAHLQIRVFEDSATPPGWTCQWDRCGIFCLDSRVWGCRWDLPARRLVITTVMTLVLLLIVWHSCDMWTGGQPIVVICGSTESCCQLTALECYDTAVASVT